MPQLPHPDDWQVFHGEATPAAAHLYARMRLAQPEAFDVLRVELVGPYCRYARTLPSTTRAQSAVRDGLVVAQAMVVDPCFWTPELPFLYRARVSLEKSGEVVWTAERMGGIRRFGTRGERFYFEAKNWVPRGGAVEPGAEFNWDAWRAHDLMAVVNEPDDSFCETADQRGLLIAARVSGPDVDVSTLLSRWERHPSVVLVILPGGTNLGGRPAASSARPVLVAHMTDATTTPDWADAVVGDWTLAQQLAAAPLPALVSRRPAEAGDPTALRAACDALQADLASVRQFAGYIAW